MKCSIFPMYISPVYEMASLYSLIWQENPEEHV